MISNIAIEWLLLLGEYAIVESILALVQELVTAILVGEVKANSILIVKRDLVVAVDLALQLADQRVHNFLQDIQIKFFDAVSLFAIFINLVLVEERLVFALSLSDFFLDRIFELFN